MIPGADAYVLSAEVAEQIKQEKATRLPRGIDAYKQLQASFDPNSSATAELADASVPAATITRLYPFQFSQYVPSLKALMTNPHLAGEVVDGVFNTTGSLTMDELVVAGFSDAMVESIQEDFFDAHHWDQLFEATFEAYTSRLDFDEVEANQALDQAEEKVEKALVSLALSALLLANWQRVQQAEEEPLWGDGTLQKAQHESKLEACLRIFNQIWLPLIRVNQAP